MVDEKKLQLTIDRNEIRHIVAKSVIARDSGQWTELAECYHTDAKLTSSWFSGTAKDFLKVSSEAKDTRKEGESQKHLTGNHWIEVNGIRAVAESDLILYQRRIIEGLELDFTTWSRRLHLMEKRDGDWKIWRRTAIYERDRMDPHNPEDIPDGFYSSMDLSQYPKQIRYHCWRNTMFGHPPVKNICLKGTEREKEVREEARNWIDGK
jgi:hypothetical protein